MCSVRTATRRPPRPPRRRRGRPQPRRPVTPSPWRRRPASIPRTTRTASPRGQARCRWCRGRGVGVQTRRARPGSPCRRRSRRARRSTWRRRSCRRATGLQSSTWSSSPTFLGSRRGPSIPPRSSPRTPRSRTTAASRGSSCGTPTPSGGGGRGTPRASAPRRPTPGSSSGRTGACSSCWGTRCWTWTSWTPRRRSRASSSCATRA
mmetsp:Transcript_41544/g.132729  ORF Transcript_41544/g.132729 Transcript_41544/m.132729 type:complete len:206 (+) Transcript_41544:116-733(+)